MNVEYEMLDLIDLISERHLLLRNYVENMWNENSDINISNSEWFIMARIYKKELTISYVTKNVDITRQAVHKFIKRLESKGLVLVSDSNENRRNKCIRLTDLGEQCYEKNQDLKAKLEKEIKDSIGEEKFELLKDILQSSWGKVEL